jgi:C4-dicarboxylate transporter/malic acid transport protein
MPFNDYNMMTRTRSKESPNSSTSKHSKSAHPKERLAHFTWAWFACTMSTGAVAVVLAQQPNTFPGLITIGTIFYILDLVLFVTFTALIATRFILRPAAFTKSLHHPGEALFSGTYWVSLALVLTGAELYGGPSTGPWLTKALEVCYWLYSGLVLLYAVFQYHILFVKERLKVSDAMPAWILPIYPFLVLGPLAGVLIPSQPQHSAVPMLIGAVMFQGLGWMVSIFMYVIYVIRLMSSDLPAPSMRPGMFISVGPAGYTATALVSLGTQAQTILTGSYLGVTSVPIGDVLHIMGTFSGIFLWLLAFWFFCLSTVGVLGGSRQMKFTLSWWAFIFPNGGLTLAAIQIGKALDSDGIKAVTSAMSILLVVFWLFTAAFHIRAVWLGQILYPNMDEDKDMDV